MNTIYDPSHATQEPIQTPTRRVTDAPTRVFHALFALMFVVAYITAESEYWRSVHIAAGYTFAALLGFRVLYSWLGGPKSLSLGALGRKLSLLPSWVRSLKNPLKINWKQGQNLTMALLVSLIMLAVAPLTISGYSLFNELGPEWWLEALEDVHEFFGNMVLLSIIGHIAMVVVMSLMRRQNMARPMWNGTVTGAGPNLVKSNRVWLAVVLSIFSITFLLYQWFSHTL